MEKKEPTDESVIIKHLFGFCSVGAPKDLDKHNCPGRYQKFFFGKVQQGRKKVDGIIYLDEYYKCTCLCHIPESERPKPKRTRKTAKKAVSRNTRKKSK